ncbi:MAG: CvpA family protein [Rhodospirillales bacterium]|nr:CvpA family protein [Rhodospirillales bacterium]
MDNLGDLPFTANVLDIGVAIILLISAFFAYMRGLVHEVLSVAGWIGAGFATVYGFPYAKPYARQITDIEIVADFGAGIVIFVVALVILSVLTHAISGRVKGSALSAIDRSLGFLFGLLRGAAIVVIAYIGMGMVYPQGNNLYVVQQSRAIELVRPAALMLIALIPDNFNTKNLAKEPKRLTPVERAATLPGKRKVIMDMIQPKPKDPKGKDGDDAVGYGKKERQQMERLNDSLPNR